MATQFTTKQKPQEQIQISEAAKMVKELEVAMTCFMGSVSLEKILESTEEYIVYMYVFSDDKVYIGRSKTSVNRFGNIESYKGQYVYRVMKKQGIKEAYILYKTKNIFIAYWFEYYLIRKYYDNSYNAALEEDWLQKAL